MTKHCLAVLGCAALGFAVSALGALPSVTDVTLKQSGQQRVEVSYTLSEEAIVTLRVLTNGAPLAASALWNVSGDVNRKVAAGEGRRIVWSIGDVWPATARRSSRRTRTCWPLLPRRPRARWSSSAAAR